MIRDRKYILTPELLLSYSKAALKNARALWDESCALIDSSHYPRAYFLACASIEETGKAFIAFNSINRKLKNGAVQNAINDYFQTHHFKLSMGLICLLINHQITEKSGKQFLDTAFNLYVGREASFYADIQGDGIITIPRELVRPKVAMQTADLADEALTATRQYFLKEDPPQYSEMDDKAFVISRQRKCLQMLQLSNFWWFYFDILKKYNNDPNTAHNVAIVYYWENYFSRNKTWKGNT